MQKNLVAINIEKNEVQSSGVAYYRLTPDMRDFIKLCAEKNEVIGFECEFGSMNFGVILGEPIEQANDRNTKDNA